MNALGRGLASLIPKRDVEADDFLERIDSMEEVEGDEVSVSVERPKRTIKKPFKAAVVEDEEPAEEETAEPVETPEEEVEPTPETPETPTQAEEEEEAPVVAPAKPTITPLVIDPDTGVLKDAKEEDLPEEVVAAVKEREVWDKHGERVEHIRLEDISVNPLQPRRIFNPIELEELARSIEAYGILQPLVVRAMEDGTYELIAGERRLRAVKQIGWERVPCVVRIDVESTRSRLELALLENIQRQNLNPIEEALAFKQLTDEYGMSHEEIGERLGRSRVAVTNTVRMLQLPAEVQRGIAEGKITAGHARTILMIPDPEKQIRFYHHLVQEGLTVRRAEVRARRIQRALKIRDFEKNKTGRALMAVKYSAPLEEKYGFSAKVNFSETKNNFEIAFYGHNERDVHELMAKLLDPETAEKIKTELSEAEAHHHEE